MPADQLCIAYYCSGHGYGHATRVSAFTRHILAARTEEEGKHIVHIVSSTPQHIFDVWDLGAKYRYAEIDPVIVQPIAYRVERRQSLQVLKKFLANKEELLERESQWLQQINADCVFTDAAFLACLAAKASGIPSVLVSNFSFDSVYSYFSTPLIDVPASPNEQDPPSLLDIMPDESIPYEEISPFVDQIHSGYRCADLLVRLPGHIFIPSFYANPPLPSFKWVDEETKKLKPEMAALLDLPLDVQALLPSLDQFSGTPKRFPELSRNRLRKVIQGPLLVRPPSTKSSVYTPEGRSAFLSAIGVPIHLHDPGETKILVVSFGGQVFKWPRTPSRSTTQNASTENLVDTANKSQASSVRIQDGLSLSTQCLDRIVNNGTKNSLPSPRLVTPGHIWIPGAPPACKVPVSPSSPRPICPPPIHELPPPNSEEFPLCQKHQDVRSSSDFDCIPQLLPDSSWIAIIVGVSKEQWEAEELPEGFYVAQRDVHIPDLNAVGDVLLGKLGYGTVAECVDACTPCVYVSRPLFIEEHGLRLFLEKDGVGVELSRQSYEAGEWASAVYEAYLKGKPMKEAKRTAMVSGIGSKKREAEITRLTSEVLGWVRDWWLLKPTPGQTHRDMQHA